MRELVSAVAVILVLTLCGCQRWCVEQGTMISTPGGSRSVESLHIGDVVLSQDESGTVCEGRVAAVRAAGALTVWRLELEDGAVVWLTGHHPVATADGWVETDRLSPGQAVCTQKGLSAVACLGTELRPTTVYDLTVEPYANFYAGGILVHNKSVAGPVTMRDAAGTWAGYTDSGTFIRLDLNADGTGVLSISYFKPENVLRGTVEWGINYRTLVGRVTSDGGVRVRGWSAEIREESMRVTLEQTDHITASSRKIPASLFRPEALERRMRAASTGEPTPGR